MPSGSSHHEPSQALCTPVYGESSVQVLTRIAGDLEAPSCGLRVKSLGAFSSFIPVPRAIVSCPEGRKAPGFCVKCDVGCRAAAATLREFSSLPGRLSVFRSERGIVPNAFLPLPRGPHVVVLFFNFFPR